MNVASAIDRLADRYLTSPWLAPRLSVGSFAQDNSAMIRFARQAPVAGSGSLKRRGRAWGVHHGSRPLLSHQQTAPFPTALPGLARFVDGLLIRQRSVEPLLLNAYQECPTKHRAAVDSAGLTTQSHSP